MHAVHHVWASQEKICSAMIIFPCLKVLSVLAIPDNATDQQCWNPTSWVDQGELWKHHPNKCHRPSLLDQSFGASTEGWSNSHQCLFMWGHIYIGRSKTGMIITTASVESYHNLHLFLNHNQSSSNQGFSNMWLYFHFLLWMLNGIYSHWARFLFSPSRSHPFLY